MSFSILIGTRCCDAQGEAFAVRRRLRHRRVCLLFEARPTLPALPPSRRRSTQPLFCHHLAMTYTEFKVPYSYSLTLWVNSLCSGTYASFDPEFRRFDNTKLEVQSRRRTGYLQLGGIRTYS